jgi:Rps23 Pro-64 3,4-dihydroxylase Tpa1-like proline 4-hydroxylase
MLNSYLNEDLISEKAIKDLKEEFKVNKPFEHLSINNFLIEKKAFELKKAIENLEFYEEDHDLYKFNRTVDFENFEDMIIESFRNFFLSKEFIEYIEKITNTNLDKTRIDLHSLKLTNTNYLLCHDDRVQDRKVAFILNLSENWEKGDRGNLEFFETDSNDLPIKILKSILPKFNQFNIFLVSEKSYHQISEVLTDKERLSISGWFYPIKGDTDTVVSLN